MSKMISDVLKSYYPIALYIVMGLLIIFVCAVFITIDDSSGSHSSPPQTPWTRFDVQRLFPASLQNAVHFAGTADTTFDITQNDDSGQTYFSYLKMIDCKASPKHCVAATPWATPQGGNSAMNFWNPNKKQTFDWDVTSGLFDGNAFGRPSEYCKLLFNVMSLNAKSPIVSNDTYKTTTVAHHYARNYLRSDLNEALTKNVLTQGWSSGIFTYNCGVMGMGCCYSQSAESNSDKLGQFCTSNTLPCKSGVQQMGHAGATYGNRVYGWFIPAMTHSYLQSDCVVMAAVNTNHDLCESFNGGWSSCLAKFLSQLPGKPIDSLTEFKNVLTQHCKAWCDDVASVYPHEGAIITLGFYMQNFDPHCDTSGGCDSEEVQLWESARVPCSDASNCPDCACPTLSVEEQVGIGTTIEPSYMLGSATKPITAALVVNQIYRLHKKMNKTTDFFTFLENVTFGELADVTQKFTKGAKFVYTETMPQELGFPGGPVTMPLVDLLFNCSTHDGNCKGVFCPCSRGGCDSGVNDAFANDSAAKRDGVYGWTNTACEDTIGKEMGQPTSKLRDWFVNLKPYDLIMMRGGIADTDTVGIDTVYQQMFRMHPFGPIQFIYQWNGFVRPPGVKCKDLKTRTSNQETCGISDAPYAAEYSSSGFTLVGTLLYLFDQMHE